MKRPRLSFLGLAGGLVLAGLGQGVSAQTIMGGASALFGGQQASFSFPSTPDRAVGFDFTQLPAGLTPLAVSETGTVVLRDDNNYYRWRAGELTTLAAYFSGNDITTLNDTTFWSKTGLTLGFDGTIAITNELWSHQRVEGTHETHDSVNQSLRIWPADGSAAVSRPAAGYTRIQYFTDDFPPPPQTLGTNQHLDPVFSSDGALWCLIYRGTRGRTAGGLSYQDLLQSLVRISPDGTVTTVRDFDGDSVGFRGVSDAGVPIGSWYDASGVRRQFVGDALADYEPQAISRGGQIIGYADGWWIYRPGQPPKAAPAEGFNFGWDTQDRLNGFIYLNYHTQPVAWLEDGPAGDWQAHPYTRLALPAGWSSLLQVPPGSTSPQVGLATNAQGTYPFLAMPNRLAVDANRDGEIHFATETIENSKVDVTSPDHPYRFWLNDDIDRTHTVDGSDSEEDDIGGSEELGMRADSAEDRVQSKRDLEDYARLWISTQGLNDAFKDESNPLCLGLQWTDTGGTTPAIKLVKHVETDGGTKYLTDDTTAQQQFAAGDAIHGVTSTYPNVALVDASDANGRFFVLPKSLFSGLSESAPKTYLLFEGVQAGKGQLRLVILKKEGGTYTKIGDGPGVWMDLKHIEDFYERWTVGDANGGLPASVAARKKITLSAVGDATGSTTGFAYDDTSPEEQKYILFVHGWNMQPWEKNRFAETTFKRLYWQGYKGRFGVFCWPTTYSFVPPLSAILDGTNYDRGEWTAWRAATPLKDLLVKLRGDYGNQVYVMAHSMGNVVTGEALRLAAQQGTGALVNTYVASQAAVPAHCYDGGRSEDIAAIFGFWQSIGRYFDGTTKLPNVYPDWLAGNGAAVGRRVNFYNESDYALWHDVWELNQFFKPDRPDGSAQPWYYSYEDDLGAPPTLHSSFIRFDHYNTDADPVGVQEMQLGSAASVQDRYEIMSFASESRTKALGAAAGSLTLSDSVNLQSIWPADNQSVKLHDGLNYSAHKWHSAQFRSTNMRQKGYWQELLGIHGFNLSTTAP